MIDGDSMAHCPLCGDINTSNDPVCLYCIRAFWYMHHPQYTNPRPIPPWRWTVKNYKKQIRMTIDEAKTLVSHLETKIGKHPQTYQKVDGRRKYARNVKMKDKTK